MPNVHTSITIAAPPTVVREVFFDWANYAWSKASLNKIEAKDDKTPVDVKEGDVLKVTTPGMSFEPNVLTNTPTTFQWRGTGLLGMFTGEHKFEFLPKDGDASQTLFVQSEVITGLLGFIAGPTWSIGKVMQKGFEGFNEELKAEVERRQAGGKSKL